MSKPSLDAYARADAALPPSSLRSEWQRQSVANALQGLMDERDAAKAATTEVGNAAADLQRRMDQYALDAVKKLRDEALERAEVAEARLASALGELGAAIVRRRKTEAKLAECVRRVRDFSDAMRRQLGTILDDFEPKTEEPGR